MTRHHSLLDSPVGMLTIVCDDDGALVGLFMEEHRHRPDDSTFGSRRAAPPTPVAEQLGDYFAGELTDFTLPLAATGTAFQTRVWSALRSIPYGVTRSYGQIAGAIGQPTASRAVGLANGRNPVSIVVPCHRVVGSTGSLTGYGGGLARKQHLLDHERRRGSRAAGRPAHR